MQSKAKTVSEYIAGLPADRKEAILTVRKMILENVDQSIEEGMTYGMIGYYVPHRIFPAGYHCDPKQPLPYAGLASQKNHISIYLMAMYENSKEENWLKAEWKKTGKKLDMGKCCIRFKRLDDIPLDLIGEAIRRLPSDVYIDRYNQALASRPNKTAAKSSAKKKPVESLKITKASKKAAHKKSASEEVAAKNVVKKVTRKVSSSKTSVAKKALSTTKEVSKKVNKKK